MAISGIDLLLGTDYRINKQSAVTTEPHNVAVNQPGRNSACKADESPKHFTVSFSHFSH